MTPILIDTSRVGPIVDAQLRDSKCADCGKTRARWTFQPEDAPVEGALLMCSICWLYDSNWGKNRREDIDALVTETENEMRTVFMRDGQRRMSSVDDADRIMGAICYLSRMMQMRGMLEKLNG